MISSRPTTMLHCTTPLHNRRAKGITRDWVKLAEHLHPGYGAGDVGANGHISPLISTYHAS